jgi:carbonic anhydrase/acetyltransferase-like protein (isoleucine patch superfamily)
MTTMSKLLRALSRSAFLVLRVILTLADKLSPRLFTTIYTYFLRKFGINFSGQPRYISTSSWFDDFELVTIGERVVISRNVVFLTHDYSITTALIANGMPPRNDIVTRRAIVIGNNVFVGLGSVLLPGTRVGDNVIIGAGSVVRGVIESDSIILGNPAVKVGTLTGTPDLWLARSRAEYATMDAK